jgi:hypothetical protein
MPLKDALHPVLQVQLALLQLNFFDLLVFRKEGAGGKFVETIVQLVVLEGQLAKLLVRLHQEVAKLVRIDRHTPASLQPDVSPRLRAASGDATCGRVGPRSPR